ncbi:MAG TPA: hypothetical protein VJ925_04850 [Longimicrobiales bacterium]|nr:hypothetical protein [Longimicrobiales bacterium]
MTDAAISSGRKALARLGRAAEKTRRELDALEGALRRAEGSDFPIDRYEELRGLIERIGDFVEEEGTRLQEKVLHSGGLEPGRIRRG